MPMPARKNFPAELSRRNLAHLSMGLLLIGLLWRTVRYLLHFPIWGDEALLATNFAWLDCGELTHRLENCQVAPLLFLWGERAAFCSMGAGMLSMRLLPFLAGIGSLFLYWRLAKLMLGPRALLFATGFLAVAIWPVSMTALLKPYSLDLFVSLALLLLAVKWLKNTDRTSWLAWLTAVTPVALLASYPSVFIAASASMAMAFPAWRKGWKTRLWFAGFNVALLVGFILASRVAAGQLSTPAGAVNTQAGMSTYWAEGFPPSSPFAFFWWFILAMTGQMTAYPAGASNGGSFVTVLLCVAGVRCWIRRGRWDWLVLLTGPVFLGVVAAALHRYPFGTSCRLNQHIAPAVCILAGLGLAAVIGKVCPKSAEFGKWALIVSAIFALLALCGIFVDVLHPYRAEGCEWMQTAMKTMLSEVPAEEPIVICAAPQTMEIVFTWYWTNVKRRITWDYSLPARPWDDKRLCGFYQGLAGADIACKRLGDALRLQNPAWHLARRIPYEYIPKSRREAGQRCELFFFERST